MKTINHSESVKKLNARLSAIVSESHEDEGAEEHRAEILSVRNLLTQGGYSDAKIIEQAEWVGLEGDLVFNSDNFDPEKIKTKDQEVEAIDKALVKINALIQELDAQGCWGLAEAMRKIVKGAYQ